MTNQSRLKAIAGKKYIVDDVEYIAVETFSGCKGCIAENNENLCNKLPICSVSDLSVIYFDYLSKT